MLNDVPQGFIRLVLTLNPQIYLQIPVNEIGRLCLRPRKYLVFLCWCILGNQGGLAETPDGDELDLNGELNDEGVYYFVQDGRMYEYATFCILNVIEATIEDTNGCQTKISDLSWTKR